MSVRHCAPLGRRAHVPPACAHWPSGRSPQKGAGDGSTARLYEGFPASSTKSHILSRPFPPRNGGLLLHSDRDP
jgi:hypothetical protein